MADAYENLFFFIRKSSAQIFKFAIDEIYRSRDTPQNAHLDRFCMQNLANRRTIHAPLFLYQLIRFTIIKHEDIVNDINYRVTRYSSRHNQLFAVPFADTNDL